MTPIRGIRLGLEQALEDYIAAYPRRTAGINKLYREGFTRHRGRYWSQQTEGQLDRNFLKGRLGVQSNAVMSTADYNFRLLLYRSHQKLGLHLDPAGMTVVATYPVPLETSDLRGPRASAIRVLSPKPPPFVP